MVKIKVCEPFIGDLEKQYVNECIDKNWLSSTAPPVKMFEDEFAQKFGAKHAIAVNSGGSALFLTLWTLGIRLGDEVIIPTFTMVATAGAVVQCGAKPVFVDCGPDDVNFNVDFIKDKITTKTKAIIPVHIYGHACEMDRIMELAKDYGLYVIEDAAEAHGAKYKDKLVGTFGIAGCFSFYANKLMTTGEGGMIITDNDELADRLRHLRAYDFDDTKHFWHKQIAWNLRMSSLEAAVGRAQLQRLDELIAARILNAKLYDEKLKDIKQIKNFPQRNNELCVFWMYFILAERRDELMTFLADAGIETRTGFFPMHWQPLFLDDKSNYPNADTLGQKGLYLPSSSNLKIEEINYIVDKIKNFYGI